MSRKIMLLLWTIVTNFQTTFLLIRVCATMKYCDG
jgi:hypothetical protein